MEFTWDSQGPGDQRHHANLHSFETRLKKEKTFWRARNEGWGQPRTGLSTPNTSLPSPPGEGAGGSRFRTWNPGAQSINKKCISPSLEKKGVYSAGRATSVSSKVAGSSLHKIAWPFPAWVWEEGKRKDALWSRSSALSSQGRERVQTPETQVSRLRASRLGRPGEYGSGSPWPSHVAAPLCVSLSPLLRLTDIIINVTMIKQQTSLLSINKCYYSKVLLLYLCICILTVINNVLQQTFSIDISHMHKSYY